MMQIELERHGERQIIRLSGHLCFWRHQEYEPRLLAAFDTCLEGGVQEIVLNLLGIKTIDSRALAALARLPIQCAQRQMALKVVMPRGVPRDAIKHIHLFDPWPKFEEESEALAGPAGSSGASK